MSTKEKLNITDRIKKINSNIKRLYSKNKKSKKKEKKGDLLSTTRNDSFEKTTKDDFLKKYFSGYRTIKGSKPLKNVKNNTNRIKISNLPINNSRISFVNSSVFIPLANNRRHLNNFCSARKIVSAGSINSSKSASVRKKRILHN